MGSMEAMKDGSAARYGHQKEDLNAKAPRRNRSAKEVAGSVSETVESLAGGLRAGLGYLGAED